RLRSTYVARSTRLHFCAFSASANGPDAASAQLSASCVFTRVNVVPAADTFLSGNASLIDSFSGSVISELSLEVPAGSALSGEGTAEGSELGIDVGAPAMGAVEWFAAWTAKNPPVATPASTRTPS